MSHATDLAWAAGFFDGEGCIYIGRSSYKGRRWQYRLFIGVTQKCPSQLLEFQRILNEGGIIEAGGPRARRLVYGSNSAIRVLKKLMPYLRGKKEQAALAVEFQKTINPKNRVPLPERDTIFREDCYQSMRSMKKVA